MSDYVRLLDDLRKGSPRMVASRGQQAADVIELLLTRIAELESDAKEHDQLWANSGKREGEMFAELRRDLGLPESRIVEDITE